MRSFNFSVDAAALKRVLLVSLAGLCMTVQAQTPGRSLADDPNSFDQFEVKYEDLSNPWAEITKLMPALPSWDTTITFYTNREGIQFAIDPASIALNRSGQTLRYTLMTRSEQGASSLTYEAMRCQYKDRRIYAFGRMPAKNSAPGTVGTWAQPARSEWDSVGLSVGKAAHAVLFDDIFCDNKTLRGDVATIVQRLKSPRKPSTLN